MIEQPKYERDDLKKMGAEWMQRIEDAGNREKAWCDDAEKAEVAYLCGTQERGEKVVATADVPDFNIIHSNVATVVPACYNSTPDPDIRPWFDRNDEPAREFASALERAISQQIDDDRLSREMEGTVQDAALAGRGITRIRFEADFVDMGGVEMPTNERVLFENISWRDYREGPAKRWGDVPWVAYRYRVSKADLAELEDEEITGQYAKDDYDTGDEDLDCELWQVWDKSRREVITIVGDYSKVISVTPDPLGLDGFFPQPDVIQPISGTGRRIPVCPHKVYETLANELDATTRRINAIVKGLKVRGLIIGGAEDIERLAEAGDNELVPIEGLEGLLAQGGIERAIAWWPIDRAVQVLAQLYQQREAIKQTIYEVTGLADIIRGASDPRETAAAQNHKAQWGSHRIKRMQRMVQSHIRDLMVLTAEVMAKQFSPEGFARAAAVQPTPELAQMLGQLDRYRIDIETDSTIKADLEHKRAEMAEFLQATSAFFTASAPLVQETPQMGVPLSEIFGSFARSFKLGKQAEDAIEQMLQMAKQVAQSDAPGAKDKEQQQKQQKEQAEFQLKQQELQIKAQEAQARLMEAQVNAQTKQASAQIEARKSQLEEVKLRLDAAKAAQEHGLQVRQQDMAEIQAELDALLRVEEMEMERVQQRPVQFG